MSPANAALAIAEACVKRANADIDRALTGAGIGAAVGGVGGYALGSGSKRKVNPWATGLTGALAGGAVGAAIPGFSAALEATNPPNQDALDEKTLPFRQKAHDNATALGRAKATILGTVPKGRSTDTEVAGAHVVIDYLSQLGRDGGGGGGNLAMLGVGAASSAHGHRLNENRRLHDLFNAGIGKRPTTPEWIKGIVPDAVAPGLPGAAAINALRADIQSGHMPPSVKGTLDPLAGVTDLPKWQQERLRGNIAAGARPFRDLPARLWNGFDSNAFDGGKVRAAAAARTANAPGRAYTGIQDAIDAGKGKLVDRAQEAFPGRWTTGVRLGSPILGYRVLRSLYKAYNEVAEPPTSGGTTK